MAIPRQSAVWDESRNSSQTRLTSPTALRDALAATESWRLAHPAHAQWIADGAPNLTDAEHVARFGQTYSDSRRTKAKPYGS